MSLEVTLIATEHIDTLTMIDTAEEIPEGGHLTITEAKLSICIEDAKILFGWATQQIVGFAFWDEHHTEMQRKPFALITTIDLPFKLVYAEPTD